ncbi:MAG: hypothetical protein WBC85_10175 [Planktotalea sp.]|uniref:hypothetical protein n=1 Tax=Planktotalea sp. TaxID=2029877 RepID=UPI003C7592C5
MTNQVKDPKCQFWCWAIAAIAGVLIFIMLQSIAGKSFFAALVLGLIAFGLLGLLFNWLFCAPVPQLGARTSSSAANAGKTAAAAAGGAVAASAVSSASASAAVEKPAPAKAAPAASAEASAPAAASAAATASEASGAVASTSAAPAAEIKPSAALAGEADLAARRGEYKYEAPAEEAKPAAKGRKGKGAGKGKGTGSGKAAGANAAGDAVAKGKGKGGGKGKAAKANAAGDATASGTAKGKGKAAAGGAGKGQGAAAAKRKADRQAAKAAEAAAATPNYDGDGKLEGANEGKKPKLRKAARKGGPDDLKRIKGIGPKLEGVCHTMGVFHFDQIAAWTADEMAWVNANLEGFKGRAARDKWVEQAKTLAAGGETEFSKRVDKGSVY